MASKTFTRNLLLGFLLLAAAFALEVSKPYTLAKDVTDIWFFDIGQGDSIFIDGKEQILIDGGPSSQVLTKLSSVLPFWDRSLDAVIATHPHADHVTGIVHVLNRYSVDYIFDSGQDYGTQIFEEFLRLDPKPIGRGSELFGDLILWPQVQLGRQRADDPNDDSVVFLFEDQGVRVLLTGDIGIDEEAQILDSIPDVDVLKVPHQGSRTSSSKEFLERANAEVGIITVGENDYGHPHTDVVNRLKRYSNQIYRTDMHGDLRVRIEDGEYEISMHRLGNY
jgi:beta-lactamase superfamily II metal-dependent hydrolase